MSVENIIKALKDGDNVNAEKEFNASMAVKMTSALDAEKINIASEIGKRKINDEDQ
tara:strand:- start:2159 stop:2326 length:168 start_codon:yes stop_codon:yes gene_type:complete